MKPSSWPPLALLAAALLPAGGLRAQRVNQALGQPVTTSGPVLDAARAASMITDGSPATYSMPSAATRTAPFAYTIDLGRRTPFYQLRILNVSALSGASAQRLTNYRVSIFTEDPAMAGTAPVWTTTVRTDGSHSGLDGVDELFAGAHATGVFSGRWLRLENLTGAYYQPQLAEFEAMSCPNLAFRKEAKAHAGTLEEQPAGALTDGNSAAGTPAAAAATADQTYELDLAEEFALDRLVLFAADECCPARLSTFHVSLHADRGGEPGEQRWSGDFRADRPQSSLSLGEVIKGENGRGDFHGRFVRLTVPGHAASAPRLTEIEAYGSLPPLIASFTSDTDIITRTGAAGRPAQATLSWRVHAATAVSISPGIGTVAAEGSVTVSPADRTIYSLTATHGEVSRNASVQLEVDAYEGPPRINEIMADNRLSLEDEDGDSPDWIELYNPSSFPRSLAGAHLSDDPAVPDHWTFPAGTILPPHGFLTVFASGKNRTNSSSALHTNFELKKSGETVSFHAPDGRTLWSRLPDDFPANPAYPPQTEDGSYGITDSGGPAFFRPATPGRANGPDGYASLLGKVDFFPERGFYTTPQQVTLTTSAPDAQIRYTTNGTLPTATTGTLYTGPITVTATTTLRAAAFLKGAGPATPGTHTYLFPGSVASQPRMDASITGDPAAGPQIPEGLMDLPSISLSLPAPGSLNLDDEQRASLEWLSPTNPLEHAATEAGATLFGGFLGDVGFDRGKKSVRLVFRAAYGDKKWTVPLFAGHDHGLAPATSFDSIELRSGHADMYVEGFYMSNLFTDQVLMEMGHLSRHGRMVHLYLNGAYWGMYHLRERWNASMHADYFGGTKQDYEAIFGDNSRGEWTPSRAYDGDDRAWQYVQSMRGHDDELRRLVDVQNLTDFMILHFVGGAQAEYRSVGPAILRGGGGGFRFVLNDADGWLKFPHQNPFAFGSRWDAATGVFTPELRSADGPAGLLAALYLAGGPDYRMLLADSIHRHLLGSGALTPGRNADRLLTMCAAVQRAIIPELARWRSPEGNPSISNHTVAGWAAARDACLDGWLPRKTEAALASFRKAGYYPALNAPAFSQNGGLFDGSAKVGMSYGILPAGTSAYGARILYTLDGTDPRLPGGLVASTALTYATPLELTRNTWVRARTLGSKGLWSALQEAFFQRRDSPPAPAGSVVPAEVHYDDSGRGETGFLELVNVSEESVNLRGGAFTSGLEYAFSSYRDTLLAPGQRLLLVNSEFAHHRRYGRGRTIGGIVSAPLKPGSGRLSFSCAGTEVFGFRPGDLRPVLGAVGDRSLTLIRPLAGRTLQDPSNWRASATVGGSPGETDDGSAFSGDPSADADGDGLSAFGEYALGSSDRAFDSAARVFVTQDEGMTVFNLRRAGTADDAVVTAEISTDLTTWHSGPEWIILHSQENLPDGRVTTRFSPGPALPAGASAFVRAHIGARP